MNSKELGRQIKRLRNLRGMTQEQFGERVDLETKSVSELERGAYLPAIETLDRIRIALETNWSELLDHQEADVTGAIRLKLIAHVMQAGLTELAALERHVSKK